MSLERRKPFALLYPNARPFDAAPTTTTTTSTALAVAAHPTISRPRRQMPAYHYHYQLQQNPHKRYATVLAGSSRSSATSSAESLYSTTSSMPRRRKLSAAEDVAARVRARWAALEALERTNSAPQQSPPAEAISASASATATIRPGARMDPRLSERPLHHHSALAPPYSELDKEREREKENAASSTATTMQVDGYEKPLPPRPAALALHINPGPGPALALAPASAGTTVAAAVLMAVDDNNAGGDAKPHHDDGGAGESLPTSDLTLRTTPTSLTCYETESIVRPAVLQRRRPTTRALTPPQVRRRPSITDELEEAVRLSIRYFCFFFFFFLNFFFSNARGGALLEGRGYARDAAQFAHGRVPAMSATRVRRALERRARAHVPPAHPCRRRRGGVYVRAVRGCIRDRAGSHPARVCAASGKGCVFCFSPLFPFLSFSALVPCPGSADDRMVPSPLFFWCVERLRSVVRAWTCLSSTGQSFGRQQQEQLQQPFQQPPKHYKRKDDNNYY